MVCLATGAFFCLGLRAHGGSDRLLAGMPDGTETVDDL